MNFRIIPLLLALVFIQCSSSSGDDGSTSTGGDISTMLVGTNVWYNDPGTIAWQRTNVAGIQSYRIGGNGYNNNLPSNSTLLDWVGKIQANKGEAILQVPQPQSEQTPSSIAAAAQFAAGVVRYFNVEQNTIEPIKYWNIGNEPWLWYDRENFTTLTPKVQEYFTAIAAAMKEVDPTIKIYGPDFSAFYGEPHIRLFGGSHDITGKVPGKDYYYIDGLAFHRYPQRNGDPATEGAEDMLNEIKQAKELIDRINSEQSRTGDDALMWGIGEFNSKNGSVVHTWGNGQMFGAVYGYGMEYGAKYITSWSMFESGGNRGGTDFSLFDGNNRVPRSSYWHSLFVAQYFTGTFVKGDVSDDDFLVYGAVDGDQLSVMIMNRGTGSGQDYTLNLKKVSLGTTGANFYVDAGRDGIYEATIEPRSTQVLIFNGTNLKKITYTSDDFSNGRGPTTEELTFE